MNNFIVITPDAWKERLFDNLENPKKRINYKTLVTIAAVIAVIITSTTGFAWSQAPEYFGSLMFRAGQEDVSSIYSSKNIVFESPSEDFSLICSGIAGDRRSLVTVLELRSNGDYCFDPEKTYFIGEWGVETIPFNLDGYSIGSSSTYVDEKTVLLDVHFNSHTLNIIGGILDIELKDIVIGFGEDAQTIIPGIFRGKIKVDYPNTVVNLNKTKNTVCTEGVTVKAKKAWISNLGFDVELRVVGSTEKIAEFEDHEIILKTMTLNYADGTSEKFNLKLPSKSEDDAVIGSVSKDEKSIAFRGKFPRLINSSEVVSLAVDDCVLFVV
ncbi:MAG: hypothetical protein IJD78_07920 [Clostridia bacterium]|nr:hypothetical protein [Clostridia bacterium]